MTGVEVAQRRAREATRIVNGVVQEGDLEGKTGLIGLAINGFWNPLKSREKSRGLRSTGRGGIQVLEMDEKGEVTSSNEF